jgi:2-methylaconitate cis-trans-isomerase PrpF
MGKAHKAVPGTLAMNLAAACQIHGTVPNRLARSNTNGIITIGHPTGTAAIKAKVDGTNVDYVEISRTARCLMRGLAFANPRDYDCTPARDEEVALLKNAMHFADAKL